MIFYRMEVQNKYIEISVFEVVGGANAITSEDGQTLYHRIKEAFDNKMIVILNFNNIELIVSTFLNASIGQLYNGIYDFAFIPTHLKIINIQNDDLEILQKVVENAKIYFANRAQDDTIYKDNIGDE